MNEQRQGSAGRQEPASGPKKAQAKRNRSTKRNPKRRNALYVLAVEFKRRHPTATAGDAWRHYTALVGMDTALVAYNATTNTLTYAPDLDRFGTREIKQNSFARQYRNL